MAIAVEMPKPGNSVEECLLAKWLKPVGSLVSEGDTIAEMETDKATFEIAATAAGTLLAIFFPQGALVPVYANICAIGKPGEDVSALAPRAREAPAVDLPATTAAPAAAAARSLVPVANVVLSPRARRFAERHRVNVQGIAGSGPMGRVLEDDVRAFFYAPHADVAAPLALQTAPRPPAEPPPGDGGIALSGIREKIARRMRDALSQTAQYTLTGSANATGLLALRRSIKHRHAKGESPDININELVLYCAVQALLRMPDLNAELRGGRLYRHREIHLGFACDTGRGLLVPVVHNAQRMTAAELSTAVKALAARATAGTISPDDLTGGTFTVSNLGGLGVESFTPVINVPQVAILGVNSIELRPVRTAGGIEMVDRIGLSLTCDHQVIDGAPGARFLGVVRECIEQVEQLGGAPCTT